MRHVSMIEIEIASMSADQKKVVQNSHNESDLLSLDLKVGGKGAFCPL